MFLNKILIMLGLKQRIRIPRVNLPPAYIHAAMERVTIEWLPNDEIYYASIAGFQGVYGTGDTEAAARTDLERSLSDWAAVRLAHGMGIPSVTGQAVHA